MITDIKKALETGDITAMEEILQKLGDWTTAATSAHTYLELKRKGLSTGDYHQLEWVYEHLKSTESSVD